MMLFTFLTYVVYSLINQETTHSTPSYEAEITAHLLGVGEGIASPEDEQV